MTETRSSLLQRLRDSSDEESWQEFVALYEPLLLRYVQSRGLSADDASDVVQDIFSSLVRVLVEFRLDRRKGRFRTWLWRVTQNAINDWARRQSRQKELKEQWAERAVLAESDPEPEWDAAIQRRILEFSLARVRSRTQPRTWQCFEEHILNGRPAADVARALEMKPGAIYVNSSRVLDRVRRSCAEYTDDHED